jgi:uncharacterized membrane protein
MPDAPTSHDSHLRSVVKGFSYRVLGTLFTTTLSFVMTGSVKTAALLGSAEVTCKIVLFWGHERAWARVRWGRPTSQAPETLRASTNMTAPAGAPAAARAMRVT